MRRGNVQDTRRVLMIAVLSVATLVPAVHAQTPVEPRGEAYFESLARRVERLDPALAQGVRSMSGWLELPEALAAAQIVAVAAPPKGTAHSFEMWHGISPFATPSALYALWIAGAAAVTTRHATNVAIRWRIGEVSRSGELPDASRCDPAPSIAQSKTAH